MNTQCRAKHSYKILMTKNKTCSPLLFMHSNSLEIQKTTELNQIEIKNKNSNNNNTKGIFTLNYLSQTYSKQQVTSSS